MFQSNLRRFSVDYRKSMYDVVISGGGMIGSTMALALGKHPAFKDFKIAVIEASPQKPKSRVSSSTIYSNRVSAINPSSKELFQKLGVWEHFRRPQVIKDMKVWGAYTDDTIHYQDDTGSIKNIGFIIENDEIIDAVSKELTYLDNVDVLYSSKIKNIETHYPHGSKASVTLNDGSVCEFSLLIGADGANSEVRKHMGVQYLSYGYNQTAIVATLNILEQENNTAWQRFLPTGPIALLPLNNNLSSLVWSTTHEEAKKLLSLPNQSFVDAINDAFSFSPVKDNSVDLMNNFLGTFLRPSKHTLNFPHVLEVAESSRASFPLGFGHAVEYVKPQVALIGDSAHKVHPLAGQGVNLGFRDVHNLTTALSDGIYCGRSLGDNIDLRKYEQTSQRSNLPIMMAIDMIYRVYTSDIGLIRAMGNLGIQLTQSISPIKNIMRQVASS